ncbi:ArsR family transcriptional regulator [Deinococcus sp.]|uniref:ArsR family transcriptional regulator n=1 Tax=Deinococcus sp. TaxID=47478 RepID=UPI003CC5E637
MPQPAESQPAHRIASAEQAALLLDVTLRPLFGLLMNTPSTASEVAASLGLELGRAHYRLTRLARAGVAEVTREARAGRALKRYRVAPRWFVPFEVTGAETLEAFVATQIIPRMEEFVELSVRQIGASFGEWGYWLEQHGESSILNMGGPGGAARELFRGDEPFMLNIGTLRLAPQQASALKRRLLALLDEFGLLHEPQQPPYTVALLLARGEVG